VKETEVRYFSMSQRKSELEAEQVVKVKVKGKVVPVL
jgi:hypothetical protein